MPGEETPHPQLNFKKTFDGFEHLQGTNKSLGAFRIKHGYKAHEILRCARPLDAFVFIPYMYFTCFAAAVEAEIINFFFTSINDICANNDWDYKSLQRDITIVPSLTSS